MQIKHRLQEYTWIKENIKELEDRLLEIDTKLQKITSTLNDDKIQTTKDPDKWTELIQKRLDICELINTEIINGLAEIHYIESMIAELPHRERLLMRYRYVDCLTWEAIAVKMGYTWQHMHRIHSKALRGIKTM